MFTTLTKDGTEILINPSKIIFATPTRDNGTVIHFNGSNFTVIDEPWDKFSARFKHKTAIELLGIPDSPTNTADLYKDLDQYPVHLPRLPTGYVDKRTTAYKEYVASL